MTISTATFPPPSPAALLLSTIIFFTNLSCVIPFATVHPTSCWSLRSKSRQLHRLWPSPTTTRCRYNNLDEIFLEAPVTTEEESWALTEDWALIDGVRAFTVAASDEAHGCYTFWDRIIRTNPQLRDRSARSAHERFILLQKNQTDSNALPAAGPSPPLLHDWWVHVDEHVVGMGGITEQGRSVWFPVRSLGRFEGHALDILAPAGGPCNLASQAVPGGYCIAIGGGVYELGGPRVRREDNKKILVSSEDNGPFRQMATVTAATLATISLLSISVGYGAGLAFSSPSTAVSTTRHVHSTGYAMRTLSSPSITELRARQEARVMKEKRVIRDIEGRLGSDEAKLLELRQLERAVENAGGLKLLPWH